MSDRTTFVSFLLDETGSMGSIRDETVEGFNAYVEELRDGGADILFSLVTFNSNHTRKRCVAEPIAEVKPLEASDYRPDAMTPLIDAAVKLIKATDEAVRQRSDDPLVVIAMQTDGRENVSVEYDNRDLAALIKEKTAAGWEFVFLGAGLDAFDAARGAGIELPRDRIASYGRARSKQAFSSLAANVREFAESGDATALGFSDAQRENFGDGHGRSGRGGGAGASRRGREDARKRARGAGTTIDDIDLTS